MNRFTGWLRRVCVCGACLAFTSTGLVTSAADAAPKNPVSAEQLQTWLAELDSDSFEVREAAAEKLAQAGPAAVEVLAKGIVSESAEIAWRSGASLERIAMTGDEKTLAKVTSVLDNLSAKGKPALRTMAAEMHARQKTFRHDRAIASLKQNGAVFNGDGTELGGIGGGPIFFGGAMPVVGGPIIVEEIEEAIEVIPELEPAPAKVGDGILGVLSRLFGEPAKEPEPPVLIPALPVDPPVIELPKIEPAEKIEIAEPQALEEVPRVDEPSLEKPVEEKPAELKAGEPARALEEFKELAEPIKKDAPADVQILAPPPAIAEAIEIAGDADIAMPIALDFIGGGIVGFDEGEAQVASSMMLGKQWRGGDDGLKVLRDVPEIWMINANGAKISDASLSYMAELPNLNNLVIHDVPVTRDGLKKLRERKPSLQVQARGEAMMGVNADIGTSPLVLTSIFAGSGAHEAGLREGDKVKTVDGSAISDFSDLTIAIYGRKAGEKVRVEYERNGEKKSAEVTLKKRPDDQ